MAPNRLYTLHSGDYKSNPAMFDKWSIVHFLSGAVAYTIWKKFSFGVDDVFTASMVWFVVHLVYELKDLFWMGYDGINGFGDQTSAMFGFWVAHMAGIGFEPQVILFFVLVRLLVAWQNPNDFLLFFK
jgi:hypothetical protein